MTLKSGMAACAAALLLATGVGALQAAEDVSGDQVTIRSVPVRYYPESLRSEAGKQAVQERLESAARRACGSVAIKDLEARRRWNECYDAALADAVNRVGSERIAAARD